MFRSFLCCYFLNQELSYSISILSLHRGDCQYKFEAVKDCGCQDMIRETGTNLNSGWLARWLDRRRKSWEAREPGKSCRQPPQGLGLKAGGESRVTRAQGHSAQSHRWAVTWQGMEDSGWPEAGLSTAKRELSAHRVRAAEGGPQSPADN